MTSLPWWVTLFGVIAPVATLAGSSVAYVVKLFQDARARRRREFLEMMEFIDTGVIAKKVAEIYQLRQFPEHKEFIVRFCTSQRANIAPGPQSAIASLVAEFDLTKAFMESVR